MHCAAAADLEFCERYPEVARRINAEVPGEMASECSLRNIRLIHISTDAVFDGLKDGSYSESDKPQPGSVYASTKYAGEQAVLRANPYAIVARVNFYGWSLSGGRSLGEFFVKQFEPGAAVKGFTDVTFCPTFVNDLGEALMQAARIRACGARTMSSGPEAMTKYEFGVAIARKFGYDESLISPQSVEEFGLAARRSHNLRLANSQVIHRPGHFPPRFLHRARQVPRAVPGGFSTANPELSTSDAGRRLAETGRLGDGPAAGTAARGNMEFKIGKHLVGPSQPTYFIADIAANHDGSLDRARMLIRLAREAGADAAKFQNFRAPKIVSDYGFRHMDSQVSHQAAWKRPVFEVYEGASLSFEWTPVLSEECAKAGIDYFTSPYDYEAIEHVAPYVPAFKIGSGEIDWIEALEHMAAKGEADPPGDRGR